MGPAASAGQVHFTPETRLDETSEEATGARRPGAEVGTGAAVMSTTEYIRYRGIMVPPLAHTDKSLEYAQNFAVKDTDVFAVTYPKSGIKFLSRPLSVVFIIQRSTIDEF